MVMEDDHPYLYQWFSARDDFTSSREHLECLTVTSSIGREGSLVLASIGWRPGTLLNILQCKGQSPSTTTNNCVAHPVSSAKG